MINKIDIADKTRIYELRNQIKQENVLEISAKSGEGVSDLKDRIFHGLVETDVFNQKETSIPNRRQTKFLEQAVERLKQCRKELFEGGSEEMVSECMKVAAITLENIVGNRDRKDLYDTIFSQFCIGK